MPQTRHPAVAGRFYTDQPAALRNEVRALLAAAIDAGPTPDNGGLADAAVTQPAATLIGRPPGDDLPRQPKAIIAPHAGYQFSGPIAASAYAAIAGQAGSITRVILLGPAHRLGFTGLAFSQATGFETPLGMVPVDHTAIAALADLPQVQALEHAFDGEHCLEVQLPFLQCLLGDFSIVPLLVGDADQDQVAAVLDRLWGGPETLIVISSDLSHYLPYPAARGVDARTSAAICGLHADAIGPEQACGRNAIIGLLAEARRHGLGARLLDLRNSGDTAGPRDQVVGYGAYVFG